MLCVTCIFIIFKEFKLEEMGKDADPEIILRLVKYLQHVKRASKAAKVKKPVENGTVSLEKINAEHIKGDLKIAFLRVFYCRTTTNTPRETSSRKSKAPKGRNPAQKENHPPKAALQHQDAR